MPRLRQVLKGVKVQKRRLGRTPRPCLPITPSILHKLKKVWLSKTPSFNNVMLWAASTITFFSFCRSGEITVECESRYDPAVHLSYADLAVDNAPFRSNPLKQTKPERGLRHILVLRVVPSHSLKVISVIKRGSTWPLVSVEGSDTTKQDQVCRACPTCSYFSEPPSSPIRWLLF